MKSLHWDKIVIDDEFHITGRGMVLSTNLFKCGIVSENYPTSIPVKSGDTLLYKGKIYEILNVEASRKTFSNILSPNIGMVVKLLEVVKEKSE